MFDAIWDLVQSALGLGADDLNAGQMALRALLTFVVTVAIVRLGDKRIFGQGTAFDIIVAITIGSILSRAVTGSSPLLATWVAGFVLVGLHRLLAHLTASVDWIGPVIKGNANLLIKDGEIDKQRMRQSGITRNDLEQVMRSQGNTGDVSDIERAYLERDGSISLLTRKRPPQIVEVAVEDGVQTVRIAVE